MVFQLPRWFLSQNVNTPLDLAGEKPRLSILTPRQNAQSADAQMAKNDHGVAVSQYLYEEAHDIVASTFVHDPVTQSLSSEANVLLTCKMNGGTELLDAFVQHLARDLDAGLITVDLEDFADLGWDFDQQENNAYQGWSLQAPFQHTPYRQTALGPALHYFALRSEDHAAVWAWNRTMRAFTAILDGLKTKDFSGGWSKEGPSATSNASLPGTAPGESGGPSRRLPVLIHVRDAKRAVELDKGTKILARLRDCVQQKRQSGERFTVIASLSHTDTSDDDCQCWICEEEKSSSTSQCSCCYDPKRRNKYHMLKRKLAIGKASTIALNTSDVSGHPGREDRFGAGSSVAAINLRQLKRNLRLRISNYFPVDLLLPDTDWTEPLEGVLKSLGKSVWSEETIERAVTRVQGRAWKKPRLDLDDIQVVLKRICLFHGPDTSGYEASSEKQGQGGHESEKWERRLREVRAKCNKLEQELLEGVIKPSDLQSNFGDVIIDENVKETIKFLTSMFQFRAETTSHFLLSQIQIKGALLYGPPGTGKTHFSRAIAKESGATMLAIDGAQVTSQWVGQTEKYIKAAFTLASKLAPCVLFIDEADSLFRRRTRDDRSWERSSVTQFLSMMDGLKHSAKVDAPFVLVATNRPMDLDEAFLRRLPQKAMIGLPTHSSRSKILRLFLKEDDLDPETDIDRLVDLTDGYSGSDLRSLCAEAALIWAIDQQRNAEKESTMTPVKVLLNNAHFDRALENIRPTVSKQSLKELEEFDRRFTSKPGKVSLKRCNVDGQTYKEGEKISMGSLSGVSNTKDQNLAQIIGETSSTSLSFLEPPTRYASAPLPAHSVAECIEFVYDHLEPYQFRLLKIHPGRDEAPLQADLIHASLTSPPPYQALSYTWGSPVPPHYLICNGVEINITKSLHDALCSARRGNEMCTMWADAVCINQKDDAEKSIQVAKMREIYSNADHLFIWIGQPDDSGDASLVADTFRHLESKFLRVLDAGQWQALLDLPPDIQESLDKRISKELGSNSAEFINHLKPSQWETFITFYLMPWFTRVWIYQEVVSIPRSAKQNITMAYGDAAIPWTMFAVVTKGLMVSRLDILLDLTGVPHKKFPSKIFDMIEWDRNVHRMTIQIPDESLDEGKVYRMLDEVTSNKIVRLHVFVEHDLKACIINQDPEGTSDWTTKELIHANDLINGAIKRYLSPSSVPPIIDKYRDYLPGRQSNGGRDSRLYLYLKLCRRLCSTDPRDKLFAFYGLLYDELGIEGNSRLKPDYKKTTDNVFIDLTLYFIQEEMCLDIFELIFDGPPSASSKIQGLPSWAVDLSQTSETGIMVPSPWISAGGTTSRGHSPHALGVAISPDRRQLEVPTYMVCEVQQLVPPGPETPKPYKDILQCLQQILETETHFHQAGSQIGNSPIDPLISAQQTMYVAGGTLYQAFLRTFWCSFLARQIFPKGEDVPEGLFQSWHNRMWSLLYGSAANNDEKSEENEKLSASIFEGTASLSADDISFSLHRQFCVTKRGFIGWVPRRARVGDTVCIFPGARMPYLIRAVEGAPRQWEMIGPAYIQGLMEGLLEQHSLYTLTEQGLVILNHVMAPTRICLV